MKRLLLFYVVLLVAVVAAIAGVLHLGSSLPVPYGTTAGGQEGAVAVANHGPTPSSPIEGVWANFNTPLSHLFLQVLVIIAVSRIVGAFFTRLRQPAVVGEMVAGILLGPSLFGAVAPGTFASVFPPDSMGTLRLLSQIGVCLFMFAVGMEVDVRQVRGKVHAAVAVSHASILFPYLLGVLLAYFFFSALAVPGARFTPFALFMGISMSITAFPVLARILQERGLSRTALGNTAITCAAVDDVTAWSILAFVVAVAGARSVGGSVVTLMLVLAFVAVMVFGVRRVLPWWIGEKRLAESEPSKATLAVVVSLVIAAALSTEVIGIHALFGSFLAGAIMPEAHQFRYKIAMRVENFSSVLLLPLFFTFTGLRTQIGLIGDLQGWLLCLVIVAVATTGKLGGSAIAARLTGMGWNESLQLGALMNTRGLMELIALNIGYDMGILSSRVFTMLVMMALVTTMMTGLLLTWFARQQTVVCGLQEPARS